MDLKQRVKESPITAFQIRAIALCFVLNLVDGYDVVVMPLSAPQVAEQWGISNVPLGYLLSASLFGMAIGAFGLTPLADFIGRRRVTLISLAFASVGMLIGFIAPNYEVLLASRVIAGIGVGGMVANITVIVSEYSNRKYAALATGIYAAGYPVGASAGGALAGVLIAQWGWREAFLLGLILTVASFILAALLMPESYEYLTSKGDEKSLKKLNVILPKMNQPTLDDLPAQTATAEKIAVSDLFKEVFSKTMWLQTVLAWVGYAMLTSSFYFANSWTTKIIATSADDANIGVTASVLYNAGGIVGSAIFGIIALKVAPRRLLSITMLVAAATYFLFGVMIDNVNLAMVIGVFAGMSVVAGVSGVYLIGPAIYPAKVRGAGFGWLMGIGRLSSIVAPILVGYLLAGGMESTTVYQLFAIPLTLSAISFFLLGVVRKRNGQSPEPTLETAQMAQVPTSTHSSVTVQSR
ncbi:MFS transporter [Rothia nasisuis]|uniref:MFS transporter n=1 Tax=Rothia nasisuis TaxID=2109647 RepID=UPI001F0017D5|nr:MFS transporter [Rothia nasisuis]